MEILVWGRPELARWDGRPFHDMARTPRDHQDAYERVIAREPWTGAPGPIHQAIGTSAGLAVLISIPGALGYIYAGWPAASRFPEVAALQLPFAIGFISIIGALLVMPTSLLVAPLGVKVAHFLTKRKLEVAFGCYLLIVSSRFVVSLVTGY